MSSVVAPSGPRTITVPGNGTGTLSFMLPPGVVLDVQAVLANIDASGAGDTTAELTISEQSGVVIAAKRQGEVIPAGDTGSATWALRLDDEQAPSGGGFTSAQGQYQGNPVSLNNGFFGFLTWNTINYGTSLLNLTTPSAPRVLTDGLYAVSAFVAPTSNMTVGGSYVLRLILDDGGQSGTVIMNSRPAAAASGTVRPQVALTVVWFVPANGIIHIGLDNLDGATRSYQLIRANVVRLT